MNNPEKPEPEKTETELSENELDQVNGGSLKPEQVTFEYGGLQVVYTQQNRNNSAELPAVQAKK